MTVKSTVLVTAVLSGLFTEAPHPPPQMVRIVGTDYAFQLPEHIRAGETIFTFNNRGSVRHEMSLALLKTGVDPDSILASLVASSARRNWLDGQASLIVSRPATSPAQGCGWIYRPAAPTS